MLRILLLPILSSVLLGLVQDDDGFCRQCGNTGKLVNPEVEKNPLEREGLFCSTYVQEDEAGRGHAFIPCDYCVKSGYRTSVADGLGEACAKSLSTLGELTKIDKDLKSTCIHLHDEVLHFVYGIPKIKQGRKVLDMHEGAHLFRDRLDAMWNDCQDLFGVDFAKDFQSNQHQIFAFHKPAIVEDVCAKYLGMNSRVGATRYGLPSKNCTYWDRSKQPTERELHKHLLHMYGHLILSSMRMGELSWLGQQGQAGWLDAGFCHYYEIKMVDPPRGATFCYQESKMHAPRNVKSWPEKLLKILASGKAASIAEIQTKATESLTYDEHILGWSWTQFLIDQHDSKKFPEFVALLKNKTPLTRAMLQVYGYNLKRFDEAWRESVIKGSRDK